MRDWIANPVLLEADVDYAAVIEIDMSEIKEPILVCLNDLDEVFIGSCMNKRGRGYFKIRNF